MLKSKEVALIITLLASSCLLVTAAPSALSAPSEGREGWWKQATQGAPSIKTCQRAVAKNPQDPIANNDLGWAYRQNGNDAQAEQYLRTALKLNPKLAQGHSNLSVVLLDQNHIDDSIAEAKQAVSIDANNPVYHVVLGNALQKKGDSKAAIEEYRAATKIRPDYENAFYHLGQALLESGDKTEAKAVLSQALGLDAHDDRVVALLDKLTD